jgi:excisionase family DNA binding protein
MELVAMEEIFTLAEASRYLKVNKATIYRLAQQGKMPAFKVGKIWRFKREKIEAWVEENSNIVRSKSER